VDPSRDATRDRLGLIRLRIVQQQLAAAEKARAAGRLDEAQGLIDRALQASPESAVLLRELAIIEVAKGAFDSAEQHARKAVEIDSGDAEVQALLGSVLESESKIADAAVAFDRAFALDPRPAWREKRDALRARAGFEALPAEYRNLPASATVTRAQLAAMIGIELEKVVAQAPRKTTAVVTDVRSHWAASWILPVTQAGLMDVLPNHTFQPNAIVRRSDLAQAVSQTLSVIGAVRSVNIAAWTAARPRLDDVPPGHVSYRAIATALAAGAMKVDDGGRFWPSRPATGAEVVAAVARLKQLAK
jgi:tetratricopeptide (TPR) repeat protein